MKNRESVHCAGCDTCNIDFNAKSVTHPQHRRFARNCAGAILERVADAGGSGNFPEDVSPFMVGLALGRILPNCTVNREDEHDGEEYLKEFLRGFTR